MGSSYHGNGFSFTICTLGWISISILRLTTIRSKFNFTGHVRNTFSMVLCISVYFVEEVNITFQSHTSSVIKFQF